MDKSTLLKIGEIISNAELDAKLDGAQDLEQIVGILREQGLEITENELMELAAENVGGELNEDALEAVAGGKKIQKSWKDVWKKIKDRYKIMRSLWPL